MIHQPEPGHVISVSWPRLWSRPPQFYFLLMILISNFLSWSFKIQEYVGRSRTGRGAQDANIEYQYLCLVNELHSNKYRAREGLATQWLVECLYGNLISMSKTAAAINNTWRQPASRSGPQSSLPASLRAERCGEGEEDFITFCNEPRTPRLYLVVISIKVFTIITTSSCSFVSGKELEFS